MALQEEMAAPEQTRTIEQAAPPGSFSKQGDPSSQGAFISVRFWMGSGEPVASPLESDSPAVCLTQDLISASQGVPVAGQGEALVAGFPSFHAAILAARRLQWAMQGLSEADGLQAASVAILIHASEGGPGQPAGGEALGLLKQAAPGQILLTEEVSRFFENLPGLPMMAAPGKGLRELLWRAPEDQSSRAVDEEVLSQLIEQQGVQIQPQEEPEPTVISEQFAAPPAGTGNLEQFRPEPARRRSPWVMVGVAMAVIALAAAGYFYWSRENSASAPEQTPAQIQTPAQTTPPSTVETTAPAAQGGQQPPAGPVKPAEQERPAAQAPAKPAKNGSKGAAKPSEQQTPQQERPQPAKAQPEQQRGRCDLDSSQYSGQIDQAWKNLGRGKYADAQREFGAVLACDPGNGRAKEGLDRARMAAREADGGSNN